MSRTKRHKGEITKFAFNYSEQEFLDVKAGRMRDYRRELGHLDKYEDYLWFVEAMSHSEAKAKYYFDRSVPGHFCNMHYERPLRRAVKREIHHSLKKDGGENLVLSTPRHMRCLGWWYW